jgi:hypothetical protein
MWSLDEPGQDSRASTPIFDPGKIRWNFFEMSPAHLAGESVAGRKARAGSWRACLLKTTMTSFRT